MGTEPGARGSGGPARLLVLHRQDNVGIVTDGACPGDWFVVEGTVWDGGPPVRETIPRGHKVALCDIPADGTVRKHGLPIGRASSPVPAGSWVHTHNVFDISEEVVRDMEARAAAGEETTG